MEISISKEYKTMGGFLNAVRHYLAKATDESPEDALSFCPVSEADGDLESIIRRTGKAYYAAPIMDPEHHSNLNIDVDINSHIYINCD